MRLVRGVSRRSVCFYRSASFYLFCLQQIQRDWRQQSVGTAARGNMSDPRSYSRKRRACCKRAVPLQTPLCLLSSPHLVRNERTRGPEGAPGLPQHHRGPDTWWGGARLRSLHCIPLTPERWDKGEGMELAEALTGHLSAPDRSVRSCTVVFVCTPTRPYQQSLCLQPSSFIRTEYTFILTFSLHLCSCFPPFQSYCPWFNLWPSHLSTQSHSAGRIIQTSELSSHLSVLLITLNGDNLISWCFFLGAFIQTCFLHFCLLQFCLTSFSFSFFVVHFPGKCMSHTSSTYTFTTCRILHPSDELTSVSARYTSSKQSYTHCNPSSDTDVMALKTEPLPDIYW